MKPIEPGVLSSSNLYFPTPSNFSKKMLYYPVALGQFFCNKHYFLKRTTYPSILVLLVLSGTLEIKYRGSTSIAEKNSIVFLNCYEQHEYHSIGDSSMLWLHFDGAQSIDLYESIYLSNGFTFKTNKTEHISELLHQLMHSFENQRLVSAPRISVSIYTLLCTLMDTSLSDETVGGHEVVDMALNYIRTNMSQNIKVRDIAKHCAISVSHFSRVFKERVGYSPYEYLIKVRVEAAKTMLKTSNASVAEVAVATGFSDACSFIVAFKSRVTLTPGEFRNLSF